MTNRFFALCFLIAMPIVAMAAEFQYRINPGDVLQIYVWNEEDLNAEVLVQPDGLIRFPMVGEVVAGGKTPGDVEVQIVEGLKRFLKDDPVVTASIGSAGGNKIYVIGNVTSPGEYQISGRIDVMQALALAGGLNSFAAQDDIRILSRGNGEQLQSVQFPYDKVKHGRSLEKNVILKSGDTVVVP